ncbi:hypothetical protein CDAR_434291 [Caerostris darwini]|uniref:Uncharacterized protein n=1 Tax=Caerostris darwini TaxID=1538125 RepID=A0AAV4UA18_9ARAC|nr:hypothetical protein CDAR_434291 [Caerostris darwini]
MEKGDELKYDHNEKLRIQKEAKNESAFHLHCRDRNRRALQPSFRNVNLVTPKAPLDTRTHFRHRLHSNINNSSLDFRGLQLPPWTTANEYEEPRRAVVLKLIKEIESCLCTQWLIVTRTSFFGKDGLFLLFSRTFVAIPTVLTAFFLGEIILTSLQNRYEQQCI